MGYEEFRLQFIRGHSGFGPSLARPLLVNSLPLYHDILLVTLMIKGPIT